MSALQLQIYLLDHYYALHHYFQQQDIIHFSSGISFFSCKQIIIQELTNEKQYIIGIHLILPINIRKIT